MSESLELRLERSLPPTLRLEREIPGGGMARVFLADDLSLTRKVVIKVLAPDLAEGLSNERFKREVLLAAKLQHPHLVPVLQAGEAEGIPYFVMPYIPGEPLRSRLTEGKPLPAREALAILRDVARAMAYAHGQGIVHRDIKPDNVLFSGGSAMVSDFGIAKALSSSRTLPPDGAALTRTGSSLGTPTYMAPEQAAADPGADHRVDLYAFGVMAYELISGRPPFHDRTPQALLTAHLVEAPGPLASKAPGLPRGLVDLVMQCLEKDPDRRPKTAQEIVDRLEDLDWSAERVAHVPASRRRTLALATAGVLVLLIGTWLWRRAAASDSSSNPHLVTVVPFRIASADPALHYLREGMLDLIAAKLPGEGGLQATDPRLLLDAWRASGGKESSDLSIGDAQKLVRHLGAGWLLQGDVVGAPTRVTLNAALFEAGTTTPRTRVSIEGPPDSLGGLVDGLVARLLTSVSEGTQQSANLTQTSLPALRAYLDGLAKFRGGSQSSVEAFRQAVDLDSTFALAALGLVQATSWYNDAALNARGLRLAWANRTQLSNKDQALLIATAGPHYPAASSTREMFEASRRYQQVAPERADAWYLHGDRIYHFGYALGLPDRATRSADFFRRALAQDSAYVPGYIHLQQLAAELGDTALDERLMRLRLARDTDRYWLDQVVWYRAAARDDTALMREVWDSVPRNDGLLYLIARMPLSVNPSPIDQSLRAYDSLVARSTNPGAERFNLTVASSMQLVAGRPREALARLRRSGPPDDPQILGRLVMDAVVEDGDSAAAAAAIPRLVKIAGTRESDDTSQAAIQRAALRAILSWRLTRGDTTGARAYLARLKAGPGMVEGPGAASLDLITVIVFEALLAEHQGQPNVAQIAARLDSLMANADFGEFRAGRLAFTALVTARLLEKHHTPAAALAAVRRRSSWWSNDMPYLAVQLREEGRLAALAGERAEAIDCYERYLNLRAMAEPELKAEVDGVRKELARLQSSEH